MLQPGQRVERFVVVREIARGGQGQVVEARAPDGQRVAIKVLLDRDVEFEQRFVREATSLAALDHPNLVRVHAFGTLPHGDPYMVLDYVAGRDLKARVREAGPFSIERALEVLVVVAETLAYCHARGITHRDVKPQNILLEDATQRPILVDFGLVKRDRAHWETQAQSLTELGDVLGTPAYMPPEQADAGSFGPVGPWSDVYGLGATLYYLLTGQPPFRGASIYNVLSALLEAPPPDPRALRPDLPPWLAELCLECLAKRPGRRPAGADALAERLRRGAATGARGLLRWLGAGLLVTALAVGLLTALAANEPPATRADATPAAASPAQASPVAPPQNTPVDLQDARDALNAHAFERALSLLADGQRAGRDDAELWSMRAYALTFLGRLDEALEASRRALDRDPWSARVQYIHGMVLNARGDVDDALVALRGATQLDPTDAGAWTTLAEFALRHAILSHDLLVEAERAARRALELEGDQPAAVWALGDSLYQQGRLEDARTWFRRYTQLAGGRLVARGRAFQLLGEYEAAAQALEAAFTAARGDRERGTARGMLSHLLAFDDDPHNDARALALAEEALALRPGGQLSLLARAELRARNGQVDEALADLRQIAKVEGVVAQPALVSLATLLRQEGDLGRAMSYLDEAIRRFPAHPQAYGRKAALLADTDPGAALGVCAQAVERRLPSTDALEVIGQIRRALDGAPSAEQPRLAAALDQLEAQVVAASRERE